MPITPESRKKMPPRGKAKKNAIIDALKSRGMEPSDFWSLVVDKATGKDGGDGNPQLITLLGQRLEAPFKPTMPPVDFGFVPGEGLDSMADKVLASGVAPDVVEKMLSVIKLRHEISERGELLKRLEGIEEKLNGSGDTQKD